jgi:hypothetical protein
MCPNLKYKRACAPMQALTSMGDAGRQARENVKRHGEYNHEASRYPAANGDSQGSGRPTAYEATPSTELTLNPILLGNTTTLTLN